MKQTPTRCSSRAGGPGIWLWNPSRRQCFGTLPYRKTRLSYLVVQCGAPCMSLCGSDGSITIFTLGARSSSVTDWVFAGDVLSCPYWSPILGMTKVLGAEHGPGSARDGCQAAGCLGRAAERSPEWDPGVLYTRSRPIDAGARLKEQQWQVRPCLPMEF